MLKEYLSEALRRPVARTIGVVTLRDMEELREDGARAAAMDAISSLVRGPVEADEVRIAGADICNNVIDSYESRFAESSLRQVAKKIVGSGMTVGHDMSGWSYATMFTAGLRHPKEGARTSDVTKLNELRDLSKATWVQGKYYWPAAASWAEDLATRIRFGITREVSAHWAFDLAICSICNDDMRKCDHYPGDSYDGKKCWYEMRDVTDYIETAFVVKGGQYGTSTYPVDGRSFVPFADAIREVKSSKRRWEDWRREIADVLDSHRAGTVKCPNCGEKMPAGTTKCSSCGKSMSASASFNGIKTPAEIFARGLKQ